MGLYNTVNFQINCTYCGFLLKTFQTKEGSCDFSVVNFSTVNNFYTICPNCGSFIEFYYFPESKERDISNYKMRIIQLKNDKNNK